jgi:hypothetical protein
MQITEFWDSTVTWQLKPKQQSQKDDSCHGNEKAQQINYSNRCFLCRPFRRYTSRAEGKLASVRVIATAQWPVEDQLWDSSQLETT